MASVNTLPPSASTPYYPKQDELPFGRSLILFLVFSILLGACTIWILAHQYMNFYALNHWSKVLGVLDSPIVRLEYLGLVYPHFPFYMMFPFHYIPMLNSGAGLPASAAIASPIWPLNVLLVIWTLRSEPPATNWSV